ncbi:hypothetical protein [Leifsonia sp. NPDC080035]|uniref:Uncharacterized protein n=1 Tax=Leifsonia sp. NPDC080035 TaxID=3143936 RepID=A0AAU7GC66_9MICO
MRYAEAEGVHLDPVLIVLAVVLTVVVIVALSVALTFARRSRLRRALEAAGIDEPTVLGYWSRLNTVPFLADPRGVPGRGVDVAVAATTQGIHLWALMRRRLTDFGLISWSAIVSIDGVRKTVGVGVETKGGVITIRTEQPVTPYAKTIELFPIGQTSAVAAERLRAADPRPIP